MLYLAPEARFDHLLTLPEAADIGAKVNAAMREIEKHNPQLAGVLPKTFNLFTGTLLKELLKKKQKGEKIERPKEQAPSNVINLMDALRQSVKDGRGKSRKPARTQRRATKKAGRSTARARKAS